MFRGIAFCVIIVAAPLASRAQESFGIYQDALLYFLNQQKPDTVERKMFLEILHGVTESFPAKIGKWSIVVVSDRNYKSVYRENGNDLELVRILPARVNGDVLEISFVTFQGGFREIRDGSIMGLFKRLNILYKYNPQKGIFEFLESKAIGY